MTFKVKKKKKKLTKEYFRQREIKELKKRYKGKVPVTQYIKTGQRFSSRFPSSTHKVGSAVSYNKKQFIVKKVSRKGVHLAPIKKSKKGFLDSGLKTGKSKFVPEKKYSGKAFPIGTFIVTPPA